MAKESQFQSNSRTPIVEYQKTVMWRTGWADDAGLYQKQVVLHIMPLFAKVRTHG